MTKPFLPTKKSEMATPVMVKKVMAVMLNRHHKVDSTNLRAIAYDPDAEVLSIEFHNGSLYRYMEVTPYEYAGLMNAPSIGNFFNTKIKNVKKFVKTTEK